MTKIWYDKELNSLCSLFFGDNFHELVMLYKNKRFKFNDKKKCWIVGLQSFNDLKSELESIGEDLDIDIYTENVVQEYFNKGVELKKQKTRQVFDNSLLKFPPLVGISPNENFQKDGILKGLSQNRYLYHLDMGLGKSYILTALYEHLYKQKRINKCLAFSTKIGVKNLTSEILGFSNSLKAEDILSISSISSYPFEKRNIFDSSAYPQKIIILSYDVLKSISNYYYDIAKGTKKTPHPSQVTDYRKSFMPIEEWIGNENAVLFLDECHSLSSPKSRRTQIMNMIVPYFEYRYLFTGTLADKYEKLYEPCWILDKNLVELKGYEEWIDTYNERGTKFSQYAINPNGWHIDKIEKLNKTLLDYSVKKKLTECLDIPTMIEVPVISVDMSPIQRKIYEKFSTHTMNSIFEKSKEDGNFSQKMLNLFPYLQMSVDNPSCLLNSENFENFDEELKSLIKKYDYVKDNSKIEYIDDILENELEENELRGLLWYYHPLTKDALEKRYKKYNPIVIGSDVSEEERFERIKTFKSSNKHKILIASIGILNTSVTLTECKFQIYVEKTFKFNDYEQSLHRIWRAGQDDITKTYSIRFNNSIDNLQEINLKTKGEVLNSLLNKSYIEKGLWKRIFNLRLADEI